MLPKTFGKIPSGKRLEKIKQSPNYKDGSFQNLSPTEAMLKEASFLKMMRDYFSNTNQVKPLQKIPSVKTNLKTIDAVNNPTIIWFGHSSYFIKIDNFTMLVDPVFSGTASPVSFFGKSFAGSDVYTVDDFPSIDLLVLTHDHYDHLDYKTIVALKQKAKQVVTPLGVGVHLEHWGFDSSIITELDWWEEHKITDAIHFTATPSRHFSGRGLKRGQSLWTSYVLKHTNHNIFIGGDSGYDSHFKTIGEKHGPFDIAILECGQYGDNWPHIHMLPEETVQATLDLKAALLLPVHWSKFTLAMHDWHEPIKRVVKEALKKNVAITTPLIGEPVILNNNDKPNSIWWNF